MAANINTNTASSEIELDNSANNVVVINNTKVSKVKSETLKVEDVFKSLGGFSRFQIFATVTIVFLEMPSAMMSLSPILTGTYQVAFYCNDTQKENLTEIPHDQLCSFKCNGSVMSKEPYISVVQEWDLYCERAWITDTLTSIQMLGGMLGPVVTAHVADQYGRKPAFYIICFLMGMSGILSAHAETLFTYGASRFLVGFAAGGGLVAHMNYLMEYLTPSWRVICGSFSLWPLGEMLLGLCGYLLPTWRRLTWITGMPALVLFITLPFLPESPRFLLVKNKTKDATQVFNSIARWNSQPKPDPETINKLQAAVRAEEAELENQKKKGMFSEFKNPFILKQIGILALSWFANAVTYFGISFNMKNMSGNRYLNVALLGAFDFPAEWSGIYFSNRFGRKWTFITALAMSSVFLAILAIVQLTVEDADDNYGILILVLCLLGRFCNEASWAVMACLTGEVFPTIIRSLSFSICSTFSSLGGIIAPQMAFLGKKWAPGPYIIFCGLSMISCGASMMLEEMKGKPLQDTSRTEKSKSTEVSTPTDTS